MRQFALSGGLAHLHSDSVLDLRIITSALPKVEHLRGASYPRLGYKRGASYSSNDVKETRLLGYYYPETQQRSAKQVIQAVNGLYGMGERQMTKPGR
ncbi:hypothetical protein PMIN04_012606 [Paraphaeosphaeria minitans]